MGVYSNLLDSTRTAIIGSATLNAWLSGTAVAADHVQFQRFKLGEPVTNIYPLLTGEGPIVFVSATGCEYKPLTPDSAELDCAIELDIVTGCSTSQQYLDACKIANDLAIELMQKADGTTPANSWMHYASGVDLRISMEKPQPMPSSKISCGMKLRAKLHPEI
jgi:hypothetical protein